MKGHPGGPQYEPFGENRAPMRDILNFSNIICVFARDILIADEAPRRTSRTKTLKNKISWGLDLRFHPRRPHRRRNVDEDVSSENALSRVPTRDVLIGAGCEMRMSRMRALLRCDFQRDVSSENAKKIKTRMRDRFPPRKLAYYSSFGPLDPILLKNWLLVRVLLG